MLFLPKQRGRKHLIRTGSSKLKTKGPVSKGGLSWVPRAHTPLVGVQYCIWTTFFRNFLDRSYFHSLSRQCNLLTYKQLFCWKTALGYPLPPQSVVGEGCCDPAAGGFHTPQHGGTKLWAPQTLYYCQVSRFLVWVFWGAFVWFFCGVLGCWVFGLVLLWFSFFKTTTSITGFLRQRNIRILPRYIQCPNLYWQKNVLSSCYQNKCVSSCSSRSNH